MPEQPPWRSAEQLSLYESRDWMNGGMEVWLAILRKPDARFKLGVSGNEPASWPKATSWSSAPRHLASRDRFIGWSGEARRRNIRYLAYNTRFLILPWISVPHLASHILGRMARQISQDWERVYGHPIYYLETFIDPERFRGTCYRAANWVVLGRTTGRGKDDQTHQANRSIKEVLGLPLTRRFRELLQQV